VDVDATPSPAIQADVAPSSRSSLRAQVATDPDVVGEPHLELEEGPGTESRRVNTSTQEFIERRRFRADREYDEALRAPGTHPPRLAARMYAAEG
jgi:hypothetical protein